MSLVSLNQFFWIFTTFDTNTSTSRNISIRSTCTSTDLSLDTHDEEILNILGELQCSADQRIVKEYTVQCRLTGNFVFGAVFNLSNKVLIDTEMRVLENELILHQLKIR